MMLLDVINFQQNLSIYPLRDTIETNTSFLISLCNQSRTANKLGMRPIDLKC